MATQNSGGYLYATTDTEAASQSFSKQAADNMYARHLEIREDTKTTAQVAAEAAALPLKDEAAAAAVAAQEAAAEAETLRVLAQQTAGKSAYQIAVDNGFVGTELEWLASLPGASGAQMVDNGTTVTFGP